MPAIAFHDIGDDDEVIAGFDQALDQESGLGLEDVFGGIISSSYDDLDYYAVILRKSFGNPF